MRALALWGREGGRRDAGIEEGLLRGYAGKQILLVIGRRRSHCVLRRNKFGLRCPGVGV